jgi:hypothetical protein
MKVKQKLISLTSASLGVLFFGFGALAESVVGTSPNVSERWDAGDNGWGLSYNYGGVVSKAATNGALTLKFRAVSSNEYISGVSQQPALCATVAASGGSFAGDYYALQVEKVCFDVKRVNVLADSEFMMYNAQSGRAWYLKFAFPPASGTSEYVTVELPLVYSEQWKSVPTGAGANEFLADKAHVDKISVKGCRDKTIADIQTLSLDNFKIVGIWVGPLFTTNGVDLNWYKEYQLTGVDADDLADTDGDGLNNRGEYFAGTNPRDANSVFKLSIERGQDGNVVLKWPHTIGRTFSLWASTDLRSGFSRRQGSIQSQSTGNSMSVGEDAGPVFFKVEIDQ